jgi:hypothetical protein
MMAAATVSWAAAVGAGAGACAGGGAAQRSLTQIAPHGRAHRCRLRRTGDIATAAAANASAGGGPAGGGSGSRSGTLCCVWLAAATQRDAAPIGWAWVHGIEGVRPRGGTQSFTRQLAPAAESIPHRRTR